MDLQNYITYVKLKPINRITKTTKKHYHTSFAYLFRNRTIKKLDLSMASKLLVNLFLC